MDKLFAITSTGKTEKSFLDLRFGKCESIVLFDPSENVYSIMDNQFMGQEKAGLSLVESLKEQGVTTIITGEVGPLVSARLEEEKIQLVLLHEERIKVDEVMDRITQR